VSDENPDSVNFPVDGFRGSRRGATAQREGEREGEGGRGQGENVTRNRRPLTPRLPARNSPSSSSSVVPRSASPTAASGSPLGCVQNYC